MTLAIAALAGGLLMTLALRVALARRRAPALPAPAAEPPPTAVLLPVRDEEENVEACVESLAAQSAPHRLRVIDDHSTDSTPARLARLRTTIPALEVLAARPLPAGWGGKVNALASGLAGLDEPWLLLTDADTRHAPDLLARAHAAVAAHRLDALSLAGRQVAAGGGEALVVPAVFALLDFLLGDWRAHARGEGRNPTANGQFFLLRRAALERIGGFEAIAGRLLDDVELARALVAGGFRVGFRGAGDALRVRMYRGFGATLAGWRRNLALFVAPRPLPTLAAAAALGAPAVALGGALALGDLPAALLAWALSALASALVRRRGERVWALAAPLDAALVAALLLLALGDRSARRQVDWRGRGIPLRGQAAEAADKRSKRP